MSEYRCPCGYTAIGSNRGIIAASEKHRPECTLTKEQKTQPSQNDRTENYLESKGIF